MPPSRWGRSSRGRSSRVCHATVYDTGSRPSRRSRSSRVTLPVGLREERRGDPKRNKRDEKWSARFKELLDYRSGHGDCDVPRSQGKLGQWVNHQRRAYMAGSLAQDRIDRLSSIGFKWALQGKTPWETRFKELLGYRSEHGDCNVPKSQGRLGRWVRQQRYVCMAGSMAQDRIDRLSSIGFKWTRKPTVLWEARFDELVQYKAKHGDCNVPWSQGQLGNWVSHQRAAYKKGKLQQDRTNHLNSIGFDWTPPIGGSRKRKDLSSTQNKSSSRKKSALLSTNEESLSAGFGAETTDEGRGALPAPSNGSHHNVGTESDDEVDEIGAYIYDQVMQRRQVSY